MKLDPSALDFSLKVLGSNRPKEFLLNNQIKLDLRKLLAEVDVKKFDFLVIYLLKC